MRKLASIQKVVSVEPIENADRLEKIKVLGWQLVAKKGEFKEGDWCVYVEIDSILPDHPDFEFMRDRKFRVKTIRLRGVISQGIAFPISILQKRNINLTIMNEGDDVTEILGVTKYEPEIPAKLGGDVLGKFPSYLVPKTDQTRIQSVPQALTRNEGVELFVTEKVDGSSGTFYYNNGHFGVCSRNLELKETEENTFWQIAREFDIENNLALQGNYAIQGEVLGPGIQKNKYGLKKPYILLFDVYDIDNQEYLGYFEFIEFARKISMPVVPIVSSSMPLEGEALKVEFWEKFANRKSHVVGADATAEGIVVKSSIEMFDEELGRFSFKSINPEFLLKHEE